MPELVVTGLTILVILVVSFGIGYLLARAEDPPARWRRSFWHGWSRRR